MSKHNMDKPFRAMKRYTDQMEKINRITTMRAICLRDKALLLKIMDFLKMYLPVLLSLG